MCGISALFCKNSGFESADAVRALASAMSELQRHRGPDNHGVFMHLTPELTVVLAHERLAIVGIEGEQPFIQDGISVTVNGEIYNHLALKEELGMPAGGSDCTVLIPMYKKYGPAFVERLDGMFAFVLFDSVQSAYLVARDHMGKVPLYSHDTPHTHSFASEMKAFKGQDMSKVQVFPPGHYYWSKEEQFTQWYAPAWFNEAVLPVRSVSAEELRDALESSVKKRMMSDVPWGVLLSGGLDSSLVAAIACRHVGDPKLVHTFSIGLEGSPDLAAAQRVADYLGTTHHAFRFTVQEGLDALQDVVYHIETYDVTTTRASTPMYLMAKQIQALNMKMVLSGEGSDELFGGYLYFHKAPDASSFYKETVQKLKNLHLYDCLRANKSMAAWGVECRTPFLGRAFVDLVMSMDPRDKMCGVNGGNRMEKHALRAAFEGYLPHDVLWRQKEQFSDGVGYNWIDGLKAQAATYCATTPRSSLSVINPPHTDEGRMIRAAFDAHFKDAAHTVPGGPSVACSTPAALEWDAAFKRLGGLGECSGRAVDVHHHASSTK
jgi:asparagine synthase (glutamine-hydrolysing)